MSSSNQTFDINKIKICYQVLELNTGASWEEVKQAYRELALVWHPDRFSDNPKLQCKAQEKLKIINQAYEMLKAYYRQRAASASKSASQTPPPPPPHKKESTNQKAYQYSSPNSHNYTSPNQKTTKDAKLSLNLRDTFKETSIILTMPNYLASVIILTPQLILIIVLTLMSKSMQDPKLEISTCAFYLLLFLGYIFTYFSGQGAVAFYIWKKLNNKTITITEAFTESVNRFFPIIGSTILYWIILIIGFIFLIIPGIYLGCSLIFYLQTIVIEKCSVTQSIKRTWYITKGHRGMIFLHTLFLNSSMSMANRLAWSDDISTSLFGQLVYLFVFPFIIAYVTTLYTKIVEFKESRQ